MAESNSERSFCSLLELSDVGKLLLSCLSLATLSAVPADNQLGGASGGLCGGCDHRRNAPQCAAAAVGQSHYGCLGSPGLVSICINVYVDVYFNCINAYVDVYFDCLLLTVNQAANNEESSG